MSQEVDPLAVGQIRENPYNGQRCIVREVVNDTHAVVDWFGWPHSSGNQDVGFTTFVRKLPDDDMVRWLEEHPHAS